MGKTLLRRLLRVGGALLGIVPDGVWIAMAATLWGIVAGVWASARQLPEYVVLLVVAYAMAAIVLVAQASVWLYWRLTLIRLLRRVEGFITEGVDIREALNASTQDARVWAGHAAAVETWRMKMHRAVLADIRAYGYRAGLTHDQDDRISTALATLEALRNDLTSRL